MAAKVAAPESPAALRGELLTDVGAVGLPRHATGQERLASLEDERLDLLLRDAQRLGDLIVSERIELGQDERRALIVRQTLHVDDQIAQVLAPLHLNRESFRDGLIEVAGRLRSPPAQHRVATVARDREQPGF